MDGLTVTCGTCGARTAVEDVASHICRSRPLHQYNNGYDDRGQRRSNEHSPGQRSLSNGNLSLSPKWADDKRAQSASPTSATFKAVPRD
jgi:hypothetical protein